MCGIIVERCIYMPMYIHTRMCRYVHMYMPFGDEKVAMHTVDDDAKSLAKI